MSIELKHVAGAKWIAVNDEGETVNEFTGKKREVEPKFEEWLATVEEPENEEVTVSAQEEEPTEGQKVELPDPTNLKGLAKTAALNAATDTTFVEAEWVSKSGVQNESNRVFNVPEGWQVTWATPRTIDGGAHASFLRSRGYRPVYVDEMGDDMYGSEMYVSYMDEDSTEFVYHAGAQLFIGPSEKLAKIREREYDARMAARDSEQEELVEDAHRIGADLRTDHETSTYNPMRS